MFVFKKVVSAFVLPPGIFVLLRWRLSMDWIRS